jgi:hypothetical protein
LRFGDQGRPGHPDQGLAGSAMLNYASIVFPYADAACQPGRAACPLWDV